MGGLSRRATIIEEKKQSGKKFIIVDSGNFSSPRLRIKDEEKEQFRLKSQLMMDSFVMNDVQALGLGQKDFVLGSEWLFQELQKHKLPFVVSNLECAGVDIPKVQKVSVDGVSFQFYSFLTEKAKIDGCTVTPPTQAWQELKKEDLGDINIMFSHLTSTELTGEFLEFDIIMETATGKRVDTPESLDQDTVLLGAGSKGKVLGFAILNLHPEHKGFRAANAGQSLDTDIERWEKKIAKLQQELEEKPGARSRLERQIKYYSDRKKTLEEKKKILGTEAKTHDILNELIPLGRDVADHPEVAKKLTKTLEDIEKATGLQTVMKYTGDYVGSERCFGCHQEQKKQWETTKHAHAWSSLSKDKREMDLECFACHSTGSLQEKGPTHPKQVDNHKLHNVGCESCHGAGFEHIKSPSKTNITKNIPVQTCTGCHDGIKDEGQFDQEKYWPRIVHESSGN